ncbi:CDP-alcohol phosphatidyltransferase family protein [Mariniluteicoccus flavus]
MSSPTPWAGTPGRWLTPADRVTLFRGALGVGCAALVAVQHLGFLPARSWWLFLLAVPTTVLDAVDGPVARHTGTVTERGARWDMEVDAAVLLVLSLAVVPWAPWALAIGLARYLFVVGGLVRPHWLGPLPFRQSRRLIAAFQAVALVTALAPFLPLWVGQGLTAVALVLLAGSFARDIRFQERRGRGFRRR